MTCSRERDISLSVVSTPIAFRRTSRCRMRRPDWSRSGIRPSPRTSARSRRGTRRSTSSPSSARSCGSRTRIARNIAQLDASGRARRRRAGAGAPARRRCSRRSSARSRMCGIPVAGADRLVLTEHIAVMDLMALADALLMPDDDLALAAVLKSPLFGLNDDDLFELAWQRQGPLRAALQGAGAHAGALRRRRGQARSPGANGRAGIRRSPSMRGCSERSAAAGSSWRGSAMRSTMRSTSSSISRSTTSVATRRRCRVSSPGCALP